MAKFLPNKNQCSGSKLILPFSNRISRPTVLPDDLSIKKKMYQVKFT